MKLILGSVTFSFCFWGNPAWANESAQPVTLHRHKILGTLANVVRVNLNCPDICLVPIRAEDIGQGYASFGSLVRSSQPLAAINGTFFDTRTATIICNLAAQGRLLTRGLKVGSLLTIDWDNQARLHGSSGVGSDWSRYDFAVSSGPTLVRHGKVAINPRAEGFRDPSLFRKAPRSALGITSDNQLLMVTVNSNVTLHQMARVMRGLGAVEALNLDGGSSTGLYCQGQYPTRPRRLMTNLLAVTTRDDGPVPRRLDDIVMWFMEPAPGTQMSEVTPVDPGEFVGPAPAPRAVNLPQE